MKEYVGLKQSVKAEPMNSLEAYDEGYLPELYSDDIEQGYHVIYKVNGAEYRTWVSKLFFENIFEEIYL